MRIVVAWYKHKLGNYLLSILFVTLDILKIKSACVLCGAVVSRSISLCHDCENDLVKIRHCCSKCGIPLLEKGHTGNPNSVCGQCGQNPPAFDYTVSLYQYVSPLDYLISQLKFNQQLSYAAIMAHLLNHHFSESVHPQGLPDAIIPTPLHKSRLVTRGFNQSLEICKLTAKNLQLEILLNTVIRTKNTQSQTDLNAKQRQKNVRNCFELLEKPKCSHIVIVDDVVTTGSTTNELAKLLKKSGVKMVGVWSIARANLS